VSRGAKRSRSETPVTGTPGLAAHAPITPSSNTRSRAATASPASAGPTGPGSSTVVPNPTSGAAATAAAPGVAQFEVLIQAFQLLPADIRRTLSAQDGVSLASSNSTQSYDETRIDDFYANCIAPFIPEQLRSEFDAVEWSDIGSLFTKACCSLELRKPGEDGALKDMLRDMWYESRLDTRSKPQPAHVLELLKKKPAEAAMDKTYRELQDGPVRDLLRLALHHGVRACKPDIPYSQTPATEIDALRTEILKLKAEARSLSSLSFSLLSEIHASRRKIMWEVTGAKSHELRDHSLWSSEDAETLHRIVDHRSWQRSMLPKIAKPTGDGGKGRGKAGKQRGKGRRGDNRPSGTRPSDGRNGTDPGTPAAEAAAPAEKSAKKHTPSKTGAKGSGKGRGK
jgi:hypothetical protein